MLPQPDECDDSCLGAPSSAATIALSSLPFVLTFFVVGTAVEQKLFPLLSGDARQNSSGDHSLPSLHRHGDLTSRPTKKRVAALTFATTIALAAVLAELILCEISNTLNLAARTLALQVTVSALLLLLIIVTPLLELHSLITSAGWDFSAGGGRGRRWLRLAWVLEIAGFGIWIGAFWWVGNGLPGAHLHEQRILNSSVSLSEACLERVGVVGISIMAILSGFASISAPWETYTGAKSRPVTDADVSRKQAGLDVTIDMLQAKQSRLRALEKKLANSPSSDAGFVTKMMGSLRGGSADMQERQSLLLEIAGLETMLTSLSSSLSLLTSRRRAQKKAATPVGKVLVLVSYAFSLYCLYRIMATCIATSRRWWSPDATFAGTDPINHVLAVVARLWNPSLDRLAWSRQISFLLSGVILAASFSSGLRTIQFFARFAPALSAGFLQQTAQANLALLVSQISATYVIASALLLRSNLPRELGGVISNALGAAQMDLAFVDRWFEGWFLIASGITAVGIFLGRKMGAGAEWDDWDEEEMEMGTKRL